ncbi:MAG: caspase family protein [Candidatus Thermoplasmatota archaeon]
MNTWIKTTTLYGFVLLLSLLLILSPMGTAGVQMHHKNIPSVVTSTPHTTPGTEYWALIFAVGVYLNHPDQDRPSMLEAADDLHSTLLASSVWKTENIHKVTGSQATGQNLIRELRWLIKQADSDDMVLIFLTTHGSPLRDRKGMPLDLPPRDETDGADEILVMYQGFDTWYAFVWDDLLNFFISRIKAHGVCLIVDSCFSGGFNDQPWSAKSENKQYTAEVFSQEFAGELAAQNRIVLMSSEEDTVSYGSYFAEYLINGLTGWADFFGNRDGINSAEETFLFAKPFVEFVTGGEQHPTIYDGYPGEFPVTS